MTTPAEQVKVPIAPTLAKLDIGQKANFPHIQYDSICQGTQRLQRKFKAIGLKFSTNTSGETIEVTRVA